MIILCSFANGTMLRSGYHNLKQAGLELSDVFFLSAVLVSFQFNSQLVLVLFYLTLFIHSYVVMYDK